MNASSSDDDQAFFKIDHDFKLVKMSLGNNFHIFSMDAISSLYIPTLNLQDRHVNV